MELHLKGKVAVVMASSQGLGRAVATQFVKEGTNVVLASRNEKQLHQVQSELERLNGGQVVYRQCDLMSKDDIDETIEYAADTFGKIDILINNAGGPKAGGFEQMTDADWQQSFELNLLSYIRTTRAALPYLKKQGGRIIQIASTSIKEPIPQLILSNTFRLGVVGLSKSLAKELAPYHILVNTVAPGRMATDRMKQLDEAEARRKGVTVEEIVKKHHRNIPLGRDGQPEEFAKVVAFLASEANTYMTGSSFFVDGGKLQSI